MVRQPVLFVAHGSPMNAIVHSEFTQCLEQWGKNILQNPPQAILMISAHWITPGQHQITGSLNPGLLHDFVGFPEELYRIQHPLISTSSLQHELLSNPDLKLSPDLDRGFDHGTWSVLKHLFPTAHIPVVQLSIDSTLSPPQQLSFGQRLEPFRNQNVLIIGSGNLVHHLGRVDRQSQGSTPSQSWALELDEALRQSLDQHNIAALLDYSHLPGARIGMQHPDHYWPFLYALGAAQSSHHHQYPYAGFEWGTLSMRCIQWN